MLTLASALIVGSLSASSRKVYKHSWLHFKSVCNMFNISHKVASVNTLLVYIAYCSQLTLSYSTVLTRISAISFVQRFRNLKDNTKSFSVRKALRGYKNVLHSNDKRKPISKQLLHHMCSNVSSFVKDHYQVLLFQSMFLLSFHAFLRVGEITITSVGTCNILHFQQVKLVSKSGKVTGIEIFFKHFKHSKHETFTLFIKKQSSRFCPVALLTQYLKLRPKVSGPLFIFQDKKPIRSSYFNTIVKSTILLINGSNCGYSSHSFRIGAATHCYQNGYSKETISIMGRWRSNAVNKYIRVLSFNV